MGRVPDLNENISEHEAIIDALEQGELNKAAALSEDHILNGLKRFQNHLLEGGFSPDRVGRLT